MGVKLARAISRGGKVVYAYMLCITKLHDPKCTENAITLLLSKKIQDIEIEMRKKLWLLDYFLSPSGSALK